MAIAACNAGALEALINLSRDPLRQAPKFAADALEKLLDFSMYLVRASKVRSCIPGVTNISHTDLSAKYWLRSRLSPSNIIPDGFYDLGAAAHHLESLRPFPSLLELKSLPVDKRREVLLIDAVQDSHLTALIQIASEGPLPSRSPRQQIRQIASVVSQAMGGSVDRSRIQDMPFKFKVTELKLQLGTNVIPLGKITQGTFYHRALLFKFLCDRLGLVPCTLVRGEYGRAWNVVDIARQTLAVPNAKPPPVPTPSTPVKSEKHSGSARTRQSMSVSKIDRDAPPAAGLVAAAANAATAPPPPSTLVSIVLPEPIDDEGPILEEPAIVDLMFDPGRLMIVDSPEADIYQRFM